MTFVCGLLMFGTSCQEHKRLANQIVDTNNEIRQLQAENSDLQEEINQINQQNLALRSHPAIRKGVGAFEQQVHLFEKEVATLTERKSSLEAEVAALRKDLEDYRGKTR